MNSECRHSPSALAVGIVLVLFSSLRCEESLPPRDEPARYLVTTFEAVGGLAVFRGGETYERPGSFFLSVRNTYVEVLQAEEDVRAEIDVWLRDEPDLRAVVTADRTNLMNPWIVLGNLLTLGPDTAATVWKQWNHRTTGGRPFWELVTLTPRVTRDGVPYLESDSVHFVASGSVRLFKHVQAERLKQVEFAVKYYIF